MAAASPTAHDVYLFHEGSLFKSYQLFGSHYRELNGNADMNSVCGRLMLRKYEWLEILTTGLEKSM